jgi:ATP-dependent helicase/nuclease subunit A
VSGVVPLDGKVDDAGWLGCLAAGLEQADMGNLPVMRWPIQAPPSPPAMPAPPADRSASEPTGVGARRPADPPEAAFGTLLHAWLEHRTGGMDEHAIATLLSLDAVQAETLAATARRILDQPELAPAFDPSRYLRAHNELEFLDADGRSARMDRLVEFAEEVWVLDYKSGGLEEPDRRRRALAHEDQMTTYHHAAQALFPHKRIRSALVFADGVVHWR